MELSSLIIDIVKTLFSPFLKVLKWLYGQLPFKVVRRKPPLKLGIIESSWREHTWEFAKHRNKDVVAIHTSWQITNTLPYNLTALNAFLTNPERVKGSVMIKSHQSDIWGHYPIPKGYTTDLNATFTIGRKHVKKPDDVLRIRIELQDPTGRTHKIDNVVVHPIIKSSVKKDLLIVENPSKLRSKIIKQVVAVLKNEVEQYKVRGRREGMLGTVEWPKGAIEWRSVDAKIQFLFENSNRDNVRSEHINALLGLYNSSLPTEKKQIVSALLGRIGKKKEYRDIGYLIIFFLFEIGYLKRGLDTALKKLRGDKANAFGDVLQILDFLLAFRYEEFKNPELDTIETFVYSTKEHPFKIKERINAIRVRSMLNNSTEK